MLFISQERADGYYCFFDPDIRLELNKISGVAYFKTRNWDGQEIIYAKYPTKKRGKEILNRIIEQRKVNPDSLFEFPEE